GADTRDVERKLSGRTPVRLDDDLLAIPTPGHTRGSACLLYRDDILFSGDHVWAGDDQTAPDAGRDVCWYSWPEQRRSIAALTDHRFTWILPGHGRRFHAASPSAMQHALRALASRM